MNLPRNYEELIAYEQETKELRGGQPVILAGDIGYINHIKATLFDAFAGTIVTGYAKDEPHPAFPTMKWAGRISETHLYITTIDPPSHLQMQYG